MDLAVVDRHLRTLYLDAGGAAGHLETVNLAAAIATKYDRGADAAAVDDGRVRAADRAERGVAVIAAEYIRNLENALEGRKPFVYKYLTLSGDGISKAVTLKVPIGTPIRYLLKLRNMETKKFNRITVPGPMKGNSVYTELTPLTKTSHGLHLIGRNKPEPEEYNTCFNCGRCTQACPVNLQIHLIGRMIEFDMCPDACDYNAELCIQCGLCGYACPANRPLVQFIKMFNKFHGFTHETNHQEIECSPKSTLEGWELALQNSPVVDSVPDSGTSR